MVNKNGDNKEVEEEETDQLGQHSRQKAWRDDYGWFMSEKIYKRIRPAKNAFSKSLPFTLFVFPLYVLRTNFRTSIFRLALLFELRFSRTILFMS